MALKKLLVIIIWTAFIVGITAFGIWWMISLRDPEALAVFQNRIDSLGTGGWLVLLGIQFTQIVLAFIPGGPIQIVAGALYGPIGGLLLLLGGILLATAVIFALVHRYGHRVLDLFVNEKDISKYKFISTQVKLAPLVVILFLIPGTPKDALTYIFAFTPITFWKFTLLSVTARVPAILVSVFMGDTIIQGSYWFAAFLFVSNILLTLAGIIFLKRKFRAYNNMIS